MMLKSSKGFLKDRFTDVWAIRANEYHLYLAQGKMLEASPTSMIHQLLHKACQHVTRSVRKKSKRHTHI